MMEPEFPDLCKTFYCISTFNANPLHSEVEKLVLYTSATKIMLEVIFYDYVFGTLYNVAK